MPAWRFSNRTGFPEELQGQLLIMPILQSADRAPWQDGSLIDYSQESFADGVTDFTLGVEEEFMLLDPATLDLAPAGAWLVAATDGDTRYHEELPASQVELTSPICQDATEIREALIEGRRDLLRATGGVVRLAGSGTHPFAGAEGATSAGPRYVQIADEYQWAARRGLAWGLHIHVAVCGAERALAVHDAIRQYLPELAALAGNSPFHEGRDTGLHSVRPKLAEAFPRQGIPPAWHIWEAYSDFLRWGSQVGSFAADGRQLWWEVRLHPGFGTVEIRVCDQPSTAAESASLAAVVQALCSQIAEEYDAGSLPAPVVRERIEENRWRALRYGLEGSLLSYRTGGTTPTRHSLECLLSELESHARRLGSGTAFADASLLLLKTGSQRQRALAAANGGNLRVVVDELASAFEGEVAVSDSGTSA